MEKAKIPLSCATPFTHVMYVRMHARMHAFTHVSRLGHTRKMHRRPRGGRQGAREEREREGGVTDQKEKEEKKERNKSACCEPPPRPHKREIVV